MHVCVFIDPDSALGRPKNEWLAPAPIDAWWRSCTITAHSSTEAYYLYDPPVYRNLLWWKYNY